MLYTPVLAKGLRETQNATLLPHLPRTLGMIKKKNLVWAYANPWLLVGVWK